MLLFCKGDCYSMISSFLVYSFINPKLQQPIDQYFVFARFAALDTLQID